MRPTLPFVACLLLLAPLPFGCALCAAPGDGAVVINELLASNDLGARDEADEAEDWIELFNPGDAAVDLGGWWLSDDITDPKKYRFADGELLPAGGFLLVWADGQTEQGSRHAPFRLAREGEEVVLTDPVDRLVDQVSFGPQETDTSEGHFPDGSGPWTSFAVPTPGAPNDASPSSDAGPLPPLPRFSEIAPSAGVPAADLSGETVDAPWVELFNPHAAAVPLAGLGLDTNVNASAPAHRFPADLPDLAPGAYRLIFLDGAEGADHAFLIGGAPVELALFDGRGGRSDVLQLAAAPPAGATAGRVGADEAFVPTTPTPGAANEALPVADAGGPPDAGYDGGRPADGGYDGGRPADGGDAGDAG